MQRARSTRGEPIRQLLRMRPAVKHVGYISKQVQPSCVAGRLTRWSQSSRFAAPRLPGSVRCDGSRALFGWLRSQQQPPVARVGAESDPYSWLQHGNEREIKSYLQAENRYAKAALRPIKKLERTLFAAMNARLDDQDHGDPEKIDGWYYYMRTRDGSAFPIYCRKASLDSEVEEVLLDQDEMASRLPYLMVPQCKISPCRSKLAYTADTTGDERYTGFIKDLSSGEIICEVPDVTTLEWATDGKTIFYTQPDRHRRPFRVWRRFIEGDGCDELILEVLSEATQEPS